MLKYVKRYEDGRETEYLDFDEDLMQTIAEETGSTVASVAFRLGRGDGIVAGEKGSRFGYTVEQVGLPEDNCERFIARFMHCQKCMEELFDGDITSSPQNYARLNVGLTSMGIQVVCTRHNVNVAHLKLDGASIVDLSDEGNFGLDEEELKPKPPEDGRCPGCGEFHDTPPTKH